MPKCYPQMLREDWNFGQEVTQQILKVWKKDGQYFFRSSIFFNKFAGNRSTLIYETLIFWEKWPPLCSIIHLKQLLFQQKKQTCWNCCGESLILSFYNSLESILRSFWLHQLTKTLFISFILWGFLWLEICINICKL